MKILHINSYYSGGFFYKNLYDRQIEDKVDIDVYVPVPNSMDTSKLDLGKYTNISHNHGKYDRVLFHFKHKKIYNDILKQYRIEEYSLFHAHSLFSNGYIAYKLNKKYDIPYIVAVRNTDINVFFNKMIHLRKLGINILKKAKNIVFISKTYRDYLMDKYIPSGYKEEFLEKSIVIPNGIDDFWLENKFYEREKPRGKEINLLYVGIVNKNKNIDTTIKTCEMFLEKGFSVRYTIIGNIKDEKQRALIEESSFINYIGHSNKEELISYYRNSDIFVMPSIHETFGIVYIEAMSQALPLIYTRGQGFDEQFEEGEVGYRVNSDSPSEIFERVKDIVDNYKYISDKCVSNVDKFSWDRIAKEYKEVYINILR